ncbi:DNA helicase [Halobacteriovorax sp. HLS]|uniref:DNA helicase n=1 Tax=Halobacteriovorax sp. HLS TaxID=2234000 RepID=UPI000FDC1449|nr:DNA helicase [Halobacteriovorax sp. HLS]
MKLSSPIHVLKSQAKALKKSQSISMSEALNKIAMREGHSSWSLLQSKNSQMLPTSYCEILDFFNEGDLVLIGARPNMGKTSFTIGLFVQAIQRKRAPNYYFTLSEVQRDVAGRIAIYDESIGNLNEHLGYIGVDYSNDINADYVIERTKATIDKESIIVIDYLQMLDEKRTNPPLQEQVEKLKKYAKDTGCIIIFISQVKRELENRLDKKPTLSDIRLPNPLDLKFINKIMLLYREGSEPKEVSVIFHRPKEYEFKVLWDREKIKFS